MQILLISNCWPIIIIGLHDFGRGLVQEVKKKGGGERGEGRKRRKERKKKEKRKEKKKGEVGDGIGTIYLISLISLKNITEY